MEMFNSIEEALAKYPKAVLAVAKMGNCMLCDEHQDLRCGACINCAPKVDGEKVKGGHRLWDVNNPDNTWYVGDVR